MKALRYSASLILLLSAVFALTASTAFASNFIWTNQTTGTSASGLQWQSITSSADGTKLAAVEGVAYSGINDVWTSTDSGHTWTNRTTGTALSGQNLSQITSSSDGTKLAVTVHHHDSGDIWTSTDSGATWTDQIASRTVVSDPLWDYLTSSTDGTKLAAVAVNDKAATTTSAIVTSDDGGVTWTDQIDNDNPTVNSQVWWAVAFSANGTKLAALMWLGDIWTGVIPPPAPPPTPAPSSGGGWSGGCSTYPQGEEPSWGVVPCTPTNPSQGPAVLPGSEASSTSTSSPPNTQSRRSTVPSGGITLSKNYQLWDTGEDILLLQQFFNTHGFIIATSGPGSSGDETDIFGFNTYRALINFQKANNLPATGYLGPLTRAALASMSTTR